MRRQILPPVVERLPAVSGEVWTTLIDTLVSVRLMRVGWTIMRLQRFRQGLPLLLLLACTRVVSAEPLPYGSCPVVTTSPVSGHYCFSGGDSFGVGAQASCGPYVTPYASHACDDREVLNVGSSDLRAGQAARNALQAMRAVDTSSRLDFATFAATYKSFTDCIDGAVDMSVCAREVAVTHLAVLLWLMHQRSEMRYAADDPQDWGTLCDGTADGLCIRSSDAVVSHVTSFSTCRYLTLLFMRQLSNGGARVIVNGVEGDTFTILATPRPDHVFAYALDLNVAGPTTIGMRRTSGTVVYVGAACAETIDHHVVFQTGLPWTSTTHRQADTEVATILSIDFSWAGRFDHVTIADWSSPAPTLVGNFYPDAASHEWFGASLRALVPELPPVDSTGGAGPIETSSTGASSVGAPLVCV